MADALMVERKAGVTLRAANAIEAEDGTAVVLVEPGGEEHGSVYMTGADLLWLVTTGGPAMVALLGGPHAINGAAKNEPWRRS